VSLCLVVRVLQLKNTSQAGEPEKTDLADALDSLARVQFKNDFDYEFESTPTGMKTGGKFVTLAKLCNVKNPSEAEQYIKDVILTFVSSFSPSNSSALSGLTEKSYFQTGCKVPMLLSCSRH